MHFLTKVAKQPPKDFAYWRDLMLGTLGAICILGCLGHTLDWIKVHNSSDRNVAIGFLLGYVFFAVLCRRKLGYVFLSLVVIAVWGVVGAVSHATLIGFVVIIPCALLAYALLRWRGDQLLK